MCERQNLKDWLWDDEEAYITLYRSVLQFLAGWFDELQFTYNRDRYHSITRDDFNLLLEDSDELEVREKDGTFYVTAVFYVDQDKKEDDPNKCILTRKTLNIVYYVDKPYPDVMRVVIQHIDGKTDFVEDECPGAS